MRGFFVLLLFQVLGEGLVLAVDLPLPGPLVGMLLLLAALLGRFGMQSGPQGSESPSLEVEGIPVGKSTILGSLILSQHRAFRRVSGRFLQAAEGASDGILQHLALFFVPAGVGIILHFERIKAEAWGLFVVVVLGTLTCLWGVAWVLQFCLSRSRSRDPSLQVEDV